ncbi:MAG: hypothetical protein RL158_1021 [Bacteroidota bacterium]
MIPKEKAKELINNFYRIIPLDKMTIDYNLAKKCALIAVEEILDEIQPFELAYEYETKIKFWNNVKQEIEQL